MLVHFFLAKFFQRKAVIERLAHGLDREIHLRLASLVYLAIDCDNGYTKLVWIHFCEWWNVLCLLPTVVDLDFVKDLIGSFRKATKVWDYQVALKCALYKESR